MKGKIMFTKLRTITDNFHKSEGVLHFDIDARAWKVYVEEWYEYETRKYIGDFTEEIRQAFILGNKEVMRDIIVHNFDARPRGVGITYHTEDGQVLEYGHKVV